MARNLSACQLRIGDEGDLQIARIGLEAGSIPKEKSSHADSDFEWPDNEESKGRIVHVLVNKALVFLTKTKAISDMAPEVANDRQIVSGRRSMHRPGEIGNIQCACVIQRSLACHKLCVYYGYGSINPIRGEAAPKETADFRTWV